MPQQPETFDAHQDMVALLQGAWRARAIHVAAELGIPDLLVSGERTVTELAELTGTHAPTLGRLLRALTTYGVFHRLPDGRTYAQSPLSAVLVSEPGNPESTDARFMAANWHWAAWGDLLHSVRTGESSFEVANGGVSFWELTKTDPDAKQRFNAAMSAVSVAESTAAARAYDFTAAHHVVDVAGGLGSLLAAILTENPALRGTILERPETVPLAEDLLAASGVDGRYEVVAGDFFDSVPPGADVYTIKRALHDWDDDTIVRILERIREAMRPDSTLLVIEGMVDEESDQEALFRGLLLTVLVGGQDRPESDYRTLATRAGLLVTRTIRITDTLRILETRLP
ncbi:MULTISPECIES: methyltransferase [unclassified Streptomyces]|uniref:methyltransferase n=1 Tax=Streptomycetaceae TaxID=2062 RepID=UPI002E770AB4|nr:MULTISPECIES: methyltransferase [unclassified Streptomyces]MED7953419.1 methyltransferase [Streptomyces sp. BE303]MEE1823115.1 methyltransferase [Streptomyces sp. BE20]